MSAMHHLYIVTNKVNGKIYIGQTKRKDRWYYHVWEAQNGKENKMLLHKAIRKYGADNFSYEILVSGIPKEKIDEYEGLFIKSFDSTNDEIGYNYLSHGNAYHGGMKGEKHPMFGRKNPKLSERNRARKGIPSSDHQKEMASLTHKGKAKSEETKQKMSQSRKEYCLNNKELVMEAIIKGNAKRIGSSRNK